MELIFEKSIPGHRCAVLPDCDVPETMIPESFARKKPLNLPEMAEVDLDRHYTQLARRVHGVNSGFYPLGSCTMKYNPRVNEETAAFPGFTGIHPLQPAATAQGCLEVLYRSESMLCSLTGMDAMSFQPAAGAHGELTGLLLFKAFHQSRGDTERTEIIVPDSAHGTNPASASMAGFTVVNIPSAPDGCVDLDALRKAAGPRTAGLMLTNPNTLGIFDRNILEITKVIHDAGGLNYYDGANMNAIMGIARPGDMGFDVVHLNLHKTFSTPHGGGGPGAGAIGVKTILEPFLPAGRAVKRDGVYALEAAPQSVGRVRSFYGNFLVVVRALTYMITLGFSGMREASQIAVLNANYMKTKLQAHCEMAGEGFCMHEFVMTLQRLKKETGITAMDVAKGMLDYGMHPPTMYFPLIVHEALMLEPTETESKETLDRACDIIISLLELARTDPDRLHGAPHSTPIRRPDEVRAARSPKLRYFKP